MNAKYVKVTTHVYGEKLLLSKAAGSEINNERHLTQSRFQLTVYAQFT